MSDLIPKEQLEQIQQIIGPIATEAVQEAIKAHGLDRVDRKYGIFPGVADNPEMLRAEREKQFFRAVLFGVEPSDPVIAKALSEGTDSAGGYLVPTEIKHELIKWANYKAVLFPLVRVMPVSSDSGNMPKAATGVNFTWSGSTENTSFTETDPTFGQVTWTVYLANGVTYMSRQVVNDSNPNIVNVVKELFAEALAEERDKMIAIGSGSSKPKGIYSETGLDSVAFGGAVSYAKLVELQYKLKQRYQKNAVWVMNSTIFGDVRALTDDNKMPIFVDGAINGQPPKILGKAYVIDDNFPDHTIFYGDLKHYIWFDREQLGIETTTTGGDTFKKHQVGLKVWFRADGKLTLNGSGKLGAGVRGTGITT